MRKVFNFTGLAAAGVLFLMLCSCQLKPPETDLTPAEIQAIQVIAFMGFQPEAEAGVEITSADLEGLDGHVLNLLVNKVYEPMPPGLMRGARAAVLEGQAESNALALARKTAQAQRADAFLLGSIYRYRQKMTDGDPPASVGLTLRLLRTSDGKLIWKGRYDETQKSILENLLNIPRYLRRGLRWFTARELAEDGITQAMSTFPARTARTEP